ncbi:MAG TPA: GNAT family N-acetyltransferase [Chitinophagaceae bacterium]|jgi:ribosomal protein S18 acetylase RimI-like enzyme|nr:GNAT family N-acetyltransferase [Chitinophagaceae bacterium]
MKVEIRKLSGGDIEQFTELIRVFEDVFEMENFHTPGRDYLQEVLANQNFFVFVAELDGRILGGLTAYVLQQYYSELPQVYIYDLAVKTEYQRQGIGRKLISGITKYSGEKGMDEVFVQADLEDTHALEFYRATGGTPEQVIHFTYALKGMP